MTPIQIIILAIIALVVVKIFQKYRQQAVTMREFFLWTVFWLIASAVVIFPRSTDSVAQFLGIEKGADLIVYLALIFLFSALFFILVRLERLERDVTKIVRKRALEEK